MIGKIIAFIIIVGVIFYMAYTYENSFTCELLYSLSPSISGFLNCGNATSVNQASNNVTQVYSNYTKIISENFNIPPSNVVGAFKNTTAMENEVEKDSGFMNVVINYTINGKTYYVPEWFVIMIAKESLNPQAFSYIKNASGSVVRVLLLMNNTPVVNNFYGNNITKGIPIIFNYTINFSEESDWIVYNFTFTQKNVKTTKYLSIPYQKVQRYFIIGFEINKKAFLIPPTAVP